MGSTIANDILKSFNQSMSVVLGHLYKEFLHYTGGKDHYALSEKDFVALAIATSNVDVMVKAVTSAQNIAEGSVAKRMHNETAALLRALEMRNHTYKDYLNQATSNTEREILKLPGKAQNLVKLFRQAQATNAEAVSSDDKAGVYEQVDDYAKVHKNLEEE